MNAPSGTITTAALIVAAGRGRRFGGPRPKQYAELHGRTVLAHTLAAFLAHPLVDRVRCVIHPDDRDLYDAAVAGFDDAELVLMTPVPGGETRQDSVRLGLESFAEDAPHKVLIHDAARPFVTPDVITSVVEALDAHEGALPAVAVTDTLKSGRDGQVTATVPREGLWRAQTPQGFRYGEILSAHRELAGEDLTDDTLLFERTQHKVALTPGAEDNFKITTEEDLMRAERLLSATDLIRTGMGFDAHALGDGNAVTLCGVEIPFSKGLLGHSDADVALHALTDAVLGALAAGDIGQHFPPSDPQWKGASSDRFLAHAAGLVHDAGGEIVNVDVTLICEAPKIGPHRDAMVERVAEILNVAPGRVSVKATTTEGMGFTGRGEGIAAQAVATVRMPKL